MNEGELLGEGTADEAIPYALRGREERKRFAERLIEFIDAYESSTEGLRQRWALNAALYQNVEPDAGLRESFINDDEDSDLIPPINRLTPRYSWQTDESYPIMQPIGDAFTANIYSTITGHGEYFSGKSLALDKDRTRDVSATIQAFADTAGFDQTLYHSILNSWLFNSNWIRVTSDVRVKGFLPFGSQPDILRASEIEYAGLEFNVISPRDIAYSPFNAPNVMACEFIGHRVQMVRVSEIREMQAAGRYITDPEIVLTETQEGWGDESQLANANALGSHDMPGVQSPQVEIWAGLAKAKLNKGQEFESWWEVELARETGELLRVRPYNYPRPWYFNTAFKPELNNLTPVSSPAQDIQPLQLAANETWSLYLDASLAQTLGAWGTDNLAALDESLAIKPGSINMIRGNLTPLIPPGNPAQGLQAIAAISEAAQRAARVSNNQMAGEFRSGVTATEAAQIAAGDAQGTNTALRLFADGLAEMWQFMQMLIADDFALFKQFYGDAIPVPEAYDDGTPGEVAMRAPIRWSVTGKEVQTTNVFRMAQVQQLLGIALQLDQMGTPVFRLSALAEAAAELSGVPDAYNILNSPEEQAAITQQRQMAQLMALAGNGGDAGSGSGPSG